MSDFVAKTAERVRATGERAYRPANGSEGDRFMSRYCYRCTKDDPDSGVFCPIIARTMALHTDEDGYPGAWIYGDDGLPRCTAFNRDWSTP